MALAEAGDRGVVGKSGWRRLPGPPHRRDMLARSGGRSVPPGSRRREGGRPSSKARVRPHPSRRCGSRRRRRRDPSRPRRRGRTRPGGPPATSRGATGAARRAGHARQQGSCRPWPIFIGDPHRAGDFTRASPGSLQIDAGRFVQQARALPFSVSIHKQAGGSDWKRFGSKPSVKSPLGGATERSAALSEVCGVVSVPAFLRGKGSAEPALSGRRPWKW